jgi:tetratricopeptide (TPR) repeat protein
MPNYPGNPSLSAEVKERVISTFEQTVALLRAGQTADAASGCEFLLRLDPMFEPARKLSEKVDNPFADVDLDALLLEVKGDGTDRLAEARTALASRDFARALDLASEALRADMLDADAQKIAEEAQERLEAAPFVDQFIRSAEEKLRNGNASGAKTDLEKARQLDPQHPSVASLTARLDEPAAPQEFSFGGGSPFAGSFGDPAPSAPADFSSPSPSFVVEEPASAFGTPASDFGFTFEEEAKAADSGFGFASPASPFASAAAPVDEPGSAHTFDFTTASVETSAEDQVKIQKYLKEGDEAFAAGEYQQAIDTWSRIFLIDVTNDDASERIESAKKKRQEVDKKIEEVTVAATLAFEKNDRETARAKFEEVLAIDPNNYNAREYLAKIEEGGTIAPSVAAPRRSAEPDIFADDFGDAGLSETPLVPPDPGATSAKKTAPAAGKVAAKKSAPTGAIVAVIALLVLGVGGYFGWQMMNRKPAYDPTATSQAFVKAERLSKAGDYDQAIAVLRTVKPEDPEHNRALEMIDDLKERKAQTAGVINGRPAVDVFREQIARGRAAFDSRDYLAAKQAFEQASAIQVLPADVKPLYDTASQQVAKLNDAILLMKENKYADAIANLESLAAQDAENVSVRQLLATAHYNNGVIEMQQDRVGNAVASFDEVLKRNPADREAKRSRELAAKYDGQQKDLMYRIYVKYLPLRQF